MAHDLIKLIGDCGLFQVILVCCVHSATLLTPWGMLFMVFGIYNPGWKCLDTPTNESFANTSAFQQNLPSTHQIESEWSVNCSLKKQCRNFTYSPEASTIVTEWDLSCDQSWLCSVMISVQMVGVLLGSYVNGQIGDKFGRKISLYGNIALFAVSNLFAGFSINSEMFMALRFFIGFGCGGIMSSAYPYPLEFVPEWWRGTLAAVPIWTTGSSLFALAIFVLRDWRHVHFLAAAISSVTFLGVFWTPESVRWLSVSGRVDQAKSVVATIARVNRRQCPDTKMIDEIAMAETTAMKGHKYTYLDLFRIKSVRGFSIKFGLIWMIMAFSYYAISFGIRSLSGDFYVNFLIFCALELPGLLTVALLVNRLGRRKTGLIFFPVLAGCTMVVVIASFTASEASKGLIIFIFVLTCRTLLEGVWSVFIIYSSELYPTVVRSLHYGFLNGVSRIGALISPYIIPNDPANAYLTYVIIGVLMVLNVALLWTLPESKGRALQDRTSCEEREVRLDDKGNGYVVTDEDSEEKVVV